MSTLISIPEYPDAERQPRLDLAAIEDRARPLQSKAVGAAIGGFARRVFSAAAVLARRLAGSIAIWARRRSLRNQLAGMPANILDDIGVNPGDLDGAVERFLGTAGDEKRPHAA